MSNLRERFAAHFGKEAVVLANAPGRLEILGNHTDYNQGFVLSCAVTQNTAVAMAPGKGKVCRLKDFRDGSERTFSLDDIDTPKKGDWANYVKGVVAELRKRDIEINGFDAGLYSTIPLSAGMSSSAALEVSFSYAFAELFGIDLPKEDWARIGQGVENDYMGLKSGLLDQFSSIFGRKDSLILSDFRSVEVLQTVKMAPGYSIVVVNSMEKHNLVDSEYNERRQDCENAAAKLGEIYSDVYTLRDVSVRQLESVKERLDNREYRRALHVVGENERVQRAMRKLDAGDMKGFGQLLFESHESSRINFENSTPWLDYLVELAQSIPGCLGARLSGGGFGGITIHLVENSAVEEYAKRISAAYKLKTNEVPEIIVCEAGDGATVEKLN